MNSAALIALTLAAGANAACTADDTTKMTECGKKVTDEMMKTPPTKDTICKTYQDVMACYPACYCDDAAFKDAIATTEKAAKDAIKTAGGGDCTLKCGSGSMLAPGMALALTVFAATYSQYE
jgi:hypothetical protein